MAESKWTKITVHCGDEQQCPFKPGITEKSPHTHRDYVPGAPKPYDDILEHVGRTPMVRCRKLEEEYGLDCELYAKCEFFSAGGSVKDRIGYRMVVDAEKEGRIKPGDTLIEPTSGNTGIGLALAAAVRGYKMIITLPEKMSSEKANTLAALGAKIYRTPTAAPFDSAESHIGVAQRLNKEIPNSHVLDQYSNPSNPAAHYDQTAEEILDQMDGKLDMLVATAGTGGTVAGLACKLKEKCPDCTIVGVDPEGSILAQPEEMNDPNHCSIYHVEGIGYDFVPRVLKRQFVDEWVKSNDTDSFLMSRKMISTMGLLCGGSCGSAMAEGVKAAKRLKKGQRCVVMLPDSIRNYMTKFLSDDWMIAEGFYNAGEIYQGDEAWRTKTVGELNLKASEFVVLESQTIQDAIKALNASGKSVLPLIDAQDAVIGVVDKNSMMNKINTHWCGLEDSVMMAKQKLRIVPASTTLGKLVSILNTCGICALEGAERTLICSQDLLDVIANVIAKAVEQKQVQVPAAVIEEPEAASPDEPERSTSTSSSPMEKFVMVGFGVALGAFCMKFLSKK